MASETRPDIIVAVDLGTTFTGVGWARPQATNALQTPIQIINNWPGCSTKNEQKVQTCLVYNEAKELSTWGFLCEEDDTPSAQRREFFKIFLDKMNLLEAQIKGLQGAPESIAQAQQFITDYLRQVYVHVKSTIEHQTGIGPFTGWKDLAVEFVFSVPTTWRTLEIINTFKAAVADAGFGTEGPRHSSTVELTESEAAAVATIKSTAVSFAKDDIFLTVDAGGGTTDFALMQVMDAAEPFPTLKQLTQVDGVGIGSTLIDRAFLDLVEDRIFPHANLVEQLPPDCIENLVRSERFKTTKHKFGEKVYSAAEYKLPMEGMGFKFNHEGARIESGRFLLTKEELQGLFDPHINSMLKKIREQLDFVQLKAFGNPQVRYLILSGGLGSSAYVRERLNESLMIDPHPNATGIKIISATDPQLVVVKGLLLDRLQKLESGSKPVLATRKARASYGMMCKMKYNPEVHFQEELKKDPLDGQTYAMSQIDWLIKKGDDVDPNEPIISSFSQKIEKGSAVRHWDSIIVISHSEVDFLPVSMKDSGAKQLCTVRSDLSGVSDADLEARRHSKGIFSRSKRWFNCSYEVRAIVGAADLTFELWYKGKKFSKNHSPIRVTWDAEGLAAAPGDGKKEVVAGSDKAGEDEAVATKKPCESEGDDASTPAASKTEGSASVTSSSSCSAPGSVSGLSSVETPRSSLAADYAEVATALKLNTQHRPRVMSEPPPAALPPTVIVQDMSDDNDDGSSSSDEQQQQPPSGNNSNNKGKQKEVIVFKPEPPRDNDLLPSRHYQHQQQRPPIVPLSRHSKRVMSMPPGGLRSASYQAGDFRVPPPQRLSHDGGAGMPLQRRRRERWSAEVPPQWRQGAVDPLRCHSVDQLPPAPKTTTTTMN